MCVNILMNTSQLHRQTRTCVLHSRLIAHSVKGGIQPAKSNFITQVRRRIVLDSVLQQADMYSR